MIVLLLSVFAFTSAFYLIGKNQMEILREERPKLWNQIAKVPYSSVLGALAHVTGSVFAEFDTEMYFDSPMTKFIFPLVLLLAFCDSIILLNILIAVMNDSFFRNSDTAESTKRIQ